MIDEFGCRASSRLPVRGGPELEVSAYGTDADESEALVLRRPSGDGVTPLVRIHSACLTGESFGSLRCDCAGQLQNAIGMIQAEGGVIIYLPRHEGRGIGLANKIRAYAFQDLGLDTVESNLRLGLPADARDYTPAVRVLKLLDISGVRLMTNNPAKIAALEASGIAVQRVPLEVPPNEHNAAYFAAKRRYFGHRLSHDGHDPDD